MPSDIPGYDRAAREHDLQEDPSQQEPETDGVLLCRGEVLEALREQAKLSGKDVPDKAKVIVYFKINGKLVPILDDDYLSAEVEWSVPDDE